MINSLVVNGDSYMKSYVRGNGHVDLADALSIQNAHSLALSGSCNGRIIRTTMKHAYNNTTPTFYIIGLSFLGRIEVPVAEHADVFEGRWLSLQNNVPEAHNYCCAWSKKHTEELISLKLRMEEHSIADRFDDLMYRVVSMIDSIKSLGHKILIFAQCDAITKDIALLPSYDLLCRPEIISRLSWLAVEWQEEQGVPCAASDISTIADPSLRHRESGHHLVLNNYLTTYIKEHKILE